MLSNTKFSVLMSIYKNESPAFFTECVESVLNQTVKPDEIVLVRDGQVPEELQQVIDRYVNEYDFFTYIPLEKNGGLGNALKVGLEHTENELVARMDTDDISFPNRFEKQLKCFEANPETAIVGGTVLEFENSTDNILSKKILPSLNEEIHRYARQRCPFNHPTVMYKKSAVLAAGSYLDFPFFEDYYLWIRMLKNGAIAQNISEPVLYMRAGSEMYKRRGGWAYLKNVYRFRTFMYKNGYCGFKDYFKAMSVQTVICLMPLKIRVFLYSKLLRKSTEKK